MAELLSIQEVAQITQLHEITIRRYIRAGKLAAVRIGRRIRVPRAALDELLQPIVPATTMLLSERPGQVGEGVAVYDAGGQSQAGNALQATIGGVALQLAQLPAEDVIVAAQFVTQLRQRQPPAPPSQMSPAEIVGAARRQAALLSDVPRAEIAARFAALAEEIRQQAREQDTAFDGDWTGD
jgi:excisionase family DNA binding protein